VGVDPFYLKMLDQNDRVGAKSPILFARSDSTVTPQLTITGSPLRAFQ